jgi:leader peptidase (prepilin peptidase)/N-methyltransferase
MFTRWVGPDGDDQTRAGVAGQSDHVTAEVIEDLPTASWWWTVGAVAAGLVLGAVASRFTRRFLQQERKTAGSWWLGAVVTAVAAGLLGWRIGARGELGVYGFVAVLAVPLGVIDWCDHRLPRALVWPQLGGALIGFGLLCVVRDDPAPGIRALAAAAALAGLLLLLAFATAGGIGAGDVRLAAVVGLVTGWLGWVHVVAALLTAMILALGLMTVPRPHQRGADRKTLVPFGPCLLAGALCIVLTSSRP